MRDKAEHAEKVERLFTQIARRYDFANDFQSFFLHRVWKKRAAKLADVKRSSLALDLCCGTGDIAFELAKFGAKVVALDFSAEMLELARQRLEEYRNSKAVKRCSCSMSSALILENAPFMDINFALGDALKLPFGDNKFDAVTIGYGLRNLSNWKQGLSEMVRVVNQGGRIVILEFGKPQCKIWGAIYFWYLKYLVPRLGKITAGDFDAYYYIFESLIRYPAQFAVADEMTKIGCHNVKIINILGGAMTINYGEKRK